MPGVMATGQDGFWQQGESVMKRGAFAVVLAFLTLLVAAGPAAANHIETTYYHDNDTSIVDWCDFPVRITGIGAYKQIDYFVKKKLPDMLEGRLKLWL